MKFRAFIFDLDGTLVHTLVDIANSMNTVLARHGFPVHKVETYTDFIGEGMRVLAKRALPAELDDPGILEWCIQEMKVEYGLTWMNNSEPYAGIQEIVLQIKQDKRKLAVFSNKPHQFTVEMVEHYFGRNLFDCILGAGQFSPKPDPEGAIQISKLLAVNPSEIVFVGDSGVDMKTAKAAGMYAAGVLWGFRGREELLLCGADIVISKPLDLSSLLGY